MEALQIAFQSLDDFINDLATQPLIVQPGTKWSYSWAYDVLGAASDSQRAACSLAFST